ncbi:MAG: restriction endonuclease subunit S [Bacteroidetes bacterium]|nr:restriction endonuclease subunit S [Bacteroidota bacterium]
MNNWEKQNLDNVADIKLSNVDKKSNLNERVVRLCNYTDVYKNSFITLEKAKAFMVGSCSENEFENFKLQKGQVAITKDSETRDDIGVSTYISEDLDEVVLGYHTSLITPDESKLNGGFLHYWLNTKQAKRYFENNAGGSGQRCTLTLDTIKSIPLYLPELEYQQKIASVLSALDAKIELNNRINAELEAMAKTIYDYWFVQFDFPDENGKPYKSSGGKMVWSEELKREVPEGWEVKSLANWIKTDKSGDWGKDIPEGNYTERVFCIRGADINGLNGKGEIKAPERFILEKNLTKILEPNDLVIEISGGSPTQSTGRLAYIMCETLKRFDAPIICSNFCKSISLKYAKSIFNFAFEWNAAYNNGILFGYEGKTSGIKNLLFESFVNSYRSAVPPKNLMDRFYELLSPLENRKQKGLLENQHLASLRDWLLPMLMNGQVKVTGP